MYVHTVNIVKKTEKERSASEIMRRVLRYSSTARRIGFYNADASVCGPRWPQSSDDELSRPDETRGIRD